MNIKVTFVDGETQILREVRNIEPFAVEPTCSNCVHTALSCHDEPCKHCFDSEHWRLG